MIFSGDKTVLWAHNTTATLTIYVTQVSALRNSYGHNAT